MNGFDFGDAPGSAGKLPGSAQKGQQSVSGQTIRPCTVAQLYRREDF